MAGNFFAIANIANYHEKLSQNIVDVEDEPPTDLPAGFTKLTNAIPLYYSYIGTREEGIEALRAGGAIEKQILAQ